MGNGNGSLSADLALLRTAVSRGAVAANAVGVGDIVTRRGRVTGAVLTDTETGQTIRVRARVVVNAAGVWRRPSS